MLLERYKNLPELIALSKIDGSIKNICKLGNDLLILAKSDLT